MSIFDFALSYQKSPIVLAGGIAANMPGGMLPIVSITQAGSYDSGVTGGSTDLQLEDYIFDFFPMAGSRLQDNQIGAYPFANQSTAANAIIQQPLSVSLMMVAPARGPSGYQTKLSTFQTLKASLDQHNQQGGTYTVATPAYLYTDCILLSLRDVSENDPKLPQSRWQWDFVQPLITLQAAQAAQNSLMSKIGSGSQVVPDSSGRISYSGRPPSVGNPASGAAPNTVPAARPTVAASAPGTFSGGNAGS